jgi:hypothetical protein
LNIESNIDSNKVYNNCSDCNYDKHSYWYDFQGIVFLYGTLFYIVVYSCFPY